MVTKYAHNGARATPSLNETRAIEERSRQLSPAAEERLTKLAESVQEFNELVKSGAVSPPSSPLPPHTKK